MKTPIPWLRVFVEGVVIVGSILLAFGIDAAWDGAKERERASEHVSALLEEVSANLQELESTALSTEGSITASRSARGLFESGWTEVPRDSVLYLLVRAGAINVLNPVTNTHDQLVATGDLRLLSREVRDALSAWQRTLRDATEYQDRYALDFRTNSGDPYYMAETAWAEIVATFFAEYSNAPVRFENDVERLSTDQRLDNLLVHKMLLDGERLRAYQGVEDALLALNDVLRGSVNGEPSGP